MPNGSRHYCATLKLEGKDKDQVWEKLVAISDCCIMGTEQGEGGYRHLQIYFKTKKRMTLGAVKEATYRDIHLEKMRGTCQEAWKYCQKEGDFREYGDCPTGRGERTDILMLKEAVKSGKSDKEIANDDTLVAVAVKYPSGFRWMKSCLREPEPYEGPRQVYIRWGSPGSGKTTWCMSRLKGQSYYKKPAHNKWWDDYNYEPAIFIDEFNAVKDGLPEEQFKNMLDPWFGAFRVESKGGSMLINPKEVFITTNMDPWTWYNGCPGLARRLEAAAVVQMEV